jgi:hypothetical protein
MLVDAGRDHGMRQLHQQRTPASQQEDVLAVDPPRDRVLVEEARSQAAALAISELIASNIGL